MSQLSSIRNKFNYVVDSASESLARGINKNPKVVLGGLTFLQTLGFLLGGSGLAITTGYLLVSFVASAAMINESDNPSTPVLNKSAVPFLSGLKYAALIQGGISLIAGFGQQGTWGHTASALTALGLAKLYNHTERLATPSPKS